MAHHENMISAIGTAPVKQYQADPAGTLLALGLDPDWPTKETYHTDDFGIDTVDLSQVYRDDPNAKKQE